MKYAGMPMGMWILFRKSFRNHLVSVLGLTETEAARVNKDEKGNTSGFASVVGKAGADFKRQFTVESYRQFFLDAGYRDVQVTLAEGRIPCAVAVVTKK